MTEHKTWVTTDGPCPSGDTDCTVDCGACKGTGKQVTGRLSSCLHTQHEVKGGIRRGWAGTGWEACSVTEHDAECESYAAQGPRRPALPCGCDERGAGRGLPCDCGHPDAAHDPEWGCADCGCSDGRQPAKGRVQARSREQIAADAKHAYFHDAALHARVEAAIRVTEHVYGVPLRDLDGLTQNALVMIASITATLTDADFAPTGEATHV